MKPEALFYRVFIVRWWAEPTEQAGQDISRFILEVPTTGERHGFISQEDLLCALQTELIAARDAQPKATNLRRDQS